MNNSGAIVLTLALSFPLLSQVGCWADAQRSTAPASQPASSPAAATQPASQPASQPTDKIELIPAPNAARLTTTIFPLSRVAPVPLRRYTIQEIARRWPEFKHEPYETSGFVHVMLPFQYKGEGKPGESNHGYSMSFLVGSAINWAPGCYCSRSAYFVFKRSRKEVKALEVSYDAGRIADLLKIWNGTYGIGGELTKTASGYSGTMEVYDRSGKLVFKKPYPQPREFFALMGDMAVDFMTFAGYTPTPELARELHATRCGPESIADLATAAFAKEWSEEELAVYEKILKRDPGFADVRYYYALRKMWKTGDDDFHHKQVKLSQESYLVPSALLDFNEWIHPDDAAGMNRWLELLDHADRLVGAEHPQFTGERLGCLYRLDKPISSELIEKAARIAARYPNSYWLLYALARVVSHQDDPSLAASLCLVALQSRFSPGSIEQSSYVASLCADSMNEAGYPHLALAMNLNIPTAAKFTLRRADYLYKLGHLDQAIRCYRSAFHAATGKETETKDEAVASALAMAILSGRDDVRDQIVRDRYEHVQRVNPGRMISGLLTFSKGLPVDNPRFKSDPDWPREWQNLWWSLHIQEGLMSSKWNGEHSSWTDRGVRECQTARPIWILYDFVDRRATSPASAAYYVAMQWLHPEDTHIWRAAKDYFRRQPKPLLLTADELLEKLFKDIPPARHPKPLEFPILVRLYSVPPLAVEAALAELIDDHEFDKAEDLALRYRHLTKGYPPYYIRAHCNHLLHLIEKARSDAAETEKFRGIRARN